MEWSGQIIVHGTAAAWACSQPECTFHGRCDHNSLGASVTEARQFLLDHYNLSHRDVKGKRYFNLVTEGVVIA
jgi:hypothetical protein